MTKDKVLTGAAGAYYVGFQFSALGYAVGLTTHGTRAIDMVVANPDTGKSITIQTKTMLNASVQSKKWGLYWKWRVGKSTHPAHITFFYAFVDLKGDPLQMPDVFIVPSTELPPLLEEYTNDIWCVIEERDTEKYKNRWGILQGALA